MKTNTSKSILLALFAVLISAFLVSCKSAPSTVNPGPLFNQSINEQIENLTKTNTTVVEEFQEFDFNYTLRPEAKYEIAKDDVLTLANLNTNSSEISFLGIMLGDSYDYLVSKLGIPNHEFIPYDNSYKNLDYAQRIGIAGIEPAITFHVENNIVTQITVKQPFIKYLHGNTSLNQRKEIIYALLDVPEYQDFIANYKVFHYVEKGIEVYFDDNTADMISFVMPKEFKGVKYIVVLEEVSKGIFANVTKAILIE